MNDDHAGSKALDQKEHNFDAGAKKVVQRYLNPDTGQWTNVVPNLVPSVDYDYLDVQQTSGSVETFVFKSGGAGGTTVLTIVLTYTDSTKNDIDTVVWS